MFDDERFKMFDLTPPCHLSFMEALKQPVPTPLETLDVSADTGKALQERIQRESETKIEELRRHQELVHNLQFQLEESKKHTMILIESNVELTQVNESLKVQIFKLEETIESHSESLKIQDKQLNLLIDNFDKNSDEAKTSKRFALVAILISLIPYFNFIILRIKSLMLLK